MLNNNLLLHQRKYCLLIAKNGIFHLWPVILRVTLIPGLAAVATAPHQLLGDHVGIFFWYERWHKCIDREERETEGKGWADGAAVICHITCLRVH